MKAALVDRVVLDRCHYRLLDRLLDLLALARHLVEVVDLAELVALESDLAARADLESVLAVLAVPLVEAADQDPGSVLDFHLEVVLHPALDLLPHHDHLQKAEAAEPEEPIKGQAKVVMARQQEKALVVLEVEPMMQKEVLVEEPRIMVEAALQI